MDLTVETRDDGATVIRLAGRLDLLAAPRMKQRLAEEVNAGPRLIVVDLGSVSFIDGSGLGSLIAGLKAARQVGGDLRVARPTEQAGTTPFKRDHVAGASGAATAGPRGSGVQGWCAGGGWPWPVGRTPAGSGTW